MRFVIAGEAYAPAKLLEVILNDGRGSVAAIFTDLENPRRLRGLADKAAIPLFDARMLGSTEGHKALEAMQPDWLLNANSTVLMSAQTLAVPSHGCLNLHPGLLPEYAGLHVHQWAIRNGETEFGATVHFMSPSVDAGDIAASVRFPIQQGDTGLSLFQRCLNEGVDIMWRLVQSILDGNNVPREEQDASSRRVYRHRDALGNAIDWSMPAQAVANFVRAGNYEPFQSPTYTPELDPPPGGGATPIVSIAKVAGISSAEPGLVCGWLEDSPLIACGDEQSVVVAKAKRDGRVMQRKDWDEYFSTLPFAKLIGKRGA